MSKTNGKSTTRKSSHYRAAPARAVVDVVLSKANPTLFSLIAFAAATGARRKELFDVKWGDIDLSGATVLIRHVKGCRKVPLPHRLVEALNSLPGEQQPTSSVFFVDKNGAPISATRISTAFRKLCECAATERPDLAVEIKALRFHDLRKFAFKQWREAGLSEREIYRLAGHSPLSTIRLFGWSSLE